ncbi:MAG: hypothetical protein M1827_004960 [Pycnora praestabilis]|nr:MAG: hypothetical protein M1827_004960 [Pycnora praestabilis]
MNLHGLGISCNPAHPLPPRSPFSDYFTERTVDNSFAGDYNATLVQRLSAIATQLAHHKVEGDISTALDDKLDELEVFLHLNAKQVEEDRHLSNPTVSPESEVKDKSDRAEGLTPTISTAPIAPEVIDLLPSSADSSDVAEVRRMLLRLSKATSELCCRQKELQHVYDLCITKNQIAEQEIRELKSQVGEFESTIQENRSELTYLKLELKILEIQVSPYIPRDDNDGLKAGIERWKLDWQDVNRRMKTRQRKDS